jgi:hypothetical protein
MSADGNLRLHPAPHLNVSDPVFWFMMQIAMVLGYVTSYPADAWLLEPFEPGVSLEDSSCRSPRFAQRHGDLRRRVVVSDE